MTSSDSESRNSTGSNSYREIVGEYDPIDEETTENRTTSEKEDKIKAEKLTEEDIKTVKWLTEAFSIEEIKKFLIPFFIVIIIFHILYELLY